MDRLCAVCVCVRACVCVKQFYLTSAFTGHNYSPTCDVAVKINLFPDFFQKLLPQNYRSYNYENSTK